MRNALLAAATLLLAGCCGGRTVRSGDGNELAAMLADLRPARVVFVGEFHDQRDHHRLQLEVIKRLHGQGADLAIGLEMFDLEQQPTLDEWVGGRLPLQDFMARYRQGWNIDWAEYDAILLFARNNGIPLVALDAPADLVRLVMRKGPGSVGDKELARLPEGAATAISTSYRDFMAQAFAGHQIPEEEFDRFCAAQGLRNSTMARRISKYLAINPGRRMVVITGIGHAMRRAVPSAISMAGLETRIIIPRVSGLYEELRRNDADYFVAAD